MAQLTLVQAINQALEQSMRKDPSVIVLGEDVGRDGGVFRVTDGLHAKFPGRVIDTPLAESGIVGASIGMAAMGLKPVAEIQFEGFMYPALDQIISHAAKLRNRSRGRFHLPMVIRSPWGGGVKALEHHSESPEAFYAHMPGIKVVIPSGPYDAKGLLVSAIKDPDPVIFFEPKKIYRSIKEEVPDKLYEIPIGKGKIALEGTDVSIITYGSMVHVAKKAAEQAEEEGISIEVIDLRSISPLDHEIIAQTVDKTGRAVIVHEAPQSCGVGAEVAAIILEHSTFSLKAPVARVTGYDIPMPLPRLEDYYLPNVDKIMIAVRKAMEFE